MVETIAVLLFDDVEILDFAGPLEVLYLLENRYKLIKTITIAKTRDPITVMGGLKVIPDHDFHDNIDLNYILIPGGLGARNMTREDEEINYLRNIIPTTDKTLSVCTGSFIAGLTDLFDGEQMTTHHMRYELFEKRFPNIDLVKNKKYVDTPRVLSAGGISSGIDMTLYFVKEKFGEKIFEEICEVMEYKTNF